MSLETFISVSLIAIAFMGVYLLADRFPWTTMIGGGLLIIAGITVATGSWVPAATWAILLAIGLSICLGTDRWGGGDDH